MKVYVSTRSEQKDEATALALALSIAGAEITAEWILMDVEEKKRECSSLPSRLKYLQKWAKIDFEQVLNCDLFVGIFTNMKCSTGGAFTELGMALAAGKHCLIVTNEEEQAKHVFLNFPRNLGQFETFDNASRLVARFKVIRQAPAIEDDGLDANAFFRP
jgi:nucleoside 2-deoxyribosyltransferase